MSVHHDEHSAFAADVGQSAGVADISEIPSPVLSYVPVACRIMNVVDLTPVEKLFTLSLADGSALDARPGQFIQLSIRGLAEAPISVCSSQTRADGFQIAVRRVGTLTRALHLLHPGDLIGVRGPLGHGFDIEAMYGKNLVLVAGGCGLAPMRSLIQYCENHRQLFGDIAILYGARSPEDMLFKDELASWTRSGKFTCHITVDNAPDASCYEGRVGLITALIPPLELAPDKTIAVIVGPPVMYRFVVAELKQKGLTENQICVSLERHMRCGAGKCGHCTIEHLYCCLDGPVFWLDTISNLRGAI